MQSVEISVVASPSKYLALVRFEDREGVVHERQAGGERKATINSNYLEALARGFQLLIKPCMVTVCCGSDYIVACFQEGWVRKWEDSGWRNSKGREVGNAGQWKQLRECMAPHSVRFIYVKGDR